MSEVLDEFVSPATEEAARREAAWTQTGVGKRGIQPHLGDLAIILGLGQPWLEKAACKSTHPDYFYPPLVEQEDEDELVEMSAFEDVDNTEEKAKAVCAGCIVRSECLEHAMRAREKFGVWGGLNKRERDNLRASRLRRIRIDRNAAAKKAQAEAAQNTTDASDKMVVNG